MVDAAAPAWAAASSLTLICVSSLMSTMPLGLVAMMENRRALPKSAMLGTTTMSPCTTGRLSSPRLARASMPSPNWICWSWLMAGASVTCLAGLTSAFLIALVADRDAGVLARQVVDVDDALALVAGVRAPDDGGRRLVALDLDDVAGAEVELRRHHREDRKSTRLNSSHIPLSRMP